MAAEPTAPPWRRGCRHDVALVCQRPAQLFLICEHTGAVHRLQLCVCATKRWQTRKAACHTARRYVRQALADYVRGLDISPVRPWMLQRMLAGTEYSSYTLVHRGRILAHSDVAPARKEDPGELFPWAELARRGHGLWAEPDPSPGDPLGRGGEGVGVFALQAGLTRLGYDLPPSGRFDADTATVVRAFQRHWRPARVDGVADGETRARLVALLRLAG